LLEFGLSSKVNFAIEDKGLVKFWIKVVYYGRYQNLEFRLQHIIHYYVVISEVANNRLDSYFIFIFSFSFYFLYFELGQKVWYDVTYNGHTSHKVWQRYNTYHRIVIYIIITVTQSCDIEKDVKDSRTDDVT